VTNDKHRSLSDALYKLTGQPLTAVTFIQDYLQISFDNSKITILALPRMVRDKTAVAWDSPVFCDFLRKEIGVHLKTAEVGRNKVAFAFENGIELLVPLDEDPSLIEKLMFTDDEGTTWVV